MPYKDKSKDTARLRKWRADNPDRVREIQARSEKNNPDAAKKRRRKSYLKTQYGISLAEYDAMFQRQRGRCAICKRPPKAGKLLFVDHNHTTNQVRGLLCHECNIMIGNAGDDVAILASGIQYLKEYE